MDIEQQAYALSNTKVTRQSGWLTKLAYGGILLLVHGFLWCSHTPESQAQELVVPSRHGKAGEQITFTLFLTRAPNAVEAFGVDVVYDPRVLEYAKTFRAEDLVRRFSFFAAYEATVGRIRIAGFTITNPIEASSSGGLVALDFIVLTAGDTALAPTNLVDGMAGWSVQAGHFISMPGETPSTEEIAQ